MVGFAKVLPGYPSIGIQRIHGVDDALQIAGANVRIDLGGLAAGMAQ